MQNFHRTTVCPIRDILSRISSKWGMLVLITLHTNGTLRFNDIQKSIGDISQRMLSVTLKALETDGLVIRKMYPEVPPRVEYTLTKRGESFIPHIQALVAWAIDNSATILEERSRTEN